MSRSPGAEDPRLFSVAAAISGGMSVNWDQVSPDPDAETTAVVEQLRVLEGVCRMSNPIPDVWGAFTITGEIGHGSYGTVYRAFDANLNLEVALKVIRAESIPYGDTSRGLNEARLLAQVNHPNVVRVYRAERVGDEVGLSMEFVQGRTLHELVRLQGPFSAKETTLIGVDICGALAAVHGARLVHGDIKAENVMRATGGRTVLMDFGAGFDVKSDRSSGRRFAGTPVYVAPEVFAGGIRTAVSDIYSVGVLLYYLASGSYPVEGHTRSEVGHRHEEHAPRRLLRDVRPDLPDAFIRVVDRAMAERPEDRYETAGKLEAALNRALSHEEPAPIPPPLFLFPSKAAVATVGVLLALGLGYGLWNTGRDTGAEPQRVVASPPPVDAVPPSAPGADTYRIEAAFYRAQGDTDLRLQSGARIAPGDQLSLQVVSSVPTYVYVVNEDDYGEAFLLFPLPGQLLSNPLPAGERHVIPGRLNGERTSWRVTSAGGREHFLIFASPQPLSPAFDRMFSALPRPTADRPVLPLSSDLAGMLRGVGGLAKTPVRLSGTGLSTEFGIPLPNAEETARGVWVRQLTLENPKR